MNYPIVLIFIFMNDDKEKNKRSVWQTLFDVLPFTDKVLRQRLHLDTPNPEKLEKEYYLFLVKKLLNTAATYGLDIDIEDALSYLEYKYKQIRHGNKKTDD